MLTFEHIESSRISMGRPSDVDYDVLDKFIAKNKGNCTMGQFKKLYPAARASEATFRRRRQAYKDNNNNLPQIPINGSKGKTVDWTLIDEFIHKNPRGTYSLLKEMIPNVQISDCSYYTRRRKLTGISSERVTGPRNTRAPKAMTVLWKSPSKNVDKNSLEILRDFAMNIGRAANLPINIIEVADPPEIWALINAK